MRDRDLKAPSSPEFRAIIEHLRARDNWRWRTAVDQPSARVERAQNVLLALATLSYVTALLALYLEWHAIALVTASIAMLVVLPFLFLQTLLPLWYLVKSIRKGTTPLKIAQARAEVNHSVLQDLATGFRSRDLEAARISLETERRFLEDRKPWMRKIAPGMALLLLALAAPHTSIRPPIGLFSLPQQLMNDPNGWFILAALLAILRPMAQVYSAAEALTAHALLLEGATRLRLEHENQESASATGSGGNHHPTSDRASGCPSSAPRWADVEETSAHQS